MKKLKDKIAFVAGGGGAPAIYIHLGILQELLFHNKKITKQVGTSAGSIVGAYYACTLSKFGNFTQQDIVKIQRFGFTAMFDTNYQGLTSLFLGKLFGHRPINKLGLMKGNKLHKYLLDFTYNMKFSDLNDDVDLYITATECLTGNLMIFSKKHTPDVLIADACRASSSIQGAFVPFGIDANKCKMFMKNSIKHPQHDVIHRYAKADKILPQYGIRKNKKYFFIDGGNNGNCRTDIASNIATDDESILGVSFTFDGKEPKPIRNFIDILNQSISILMKGTESLVQKYTELKKPNIILLYPDKHNIDTCDFELPLHVKAELIFSGTKSIRPWLN